MASQDSSHFFSGCKSLEELKKRYRELCKVHHPDLGGSEETMKRLNAEYERLVRGGLFAEEMERTGTDEDIESAFREVLEKLTVLSGLVLEICGSWLWVTGSTYQVKDQLKALGLKFASKKVAWFWRPDGEKSRNRKPLSLDEIRQRHGSKLVSFGTVSRALS
jgi:hypothetical protein